jgi:hypothetical protein
VTLDYKYADFLALDTNCIQVKSPITIEKQRNTFTMTFVPDRPRPDIRKLLGIIECGDYQTFKELFRESKERREACQRNEAGGYPTINPSENFKEA